MEFGGGKIEVAGDSGGREDSIRSLVRHGGIGEAAEEGEFFKRGYRHTTVVDDEIASTVYINIANKTIGGTQECQGTDISERSESNGRTYRIGILES